MIPPRAALGPPRTLMAFERRFHDEEECRAYLEELRWPHGFRCACGEERAWKTARGLWKCPVCRKATSVTAGTVFHRSHLPLMIWFRAIWWVTSHRTGSSALGLQQTLGLGSYRTAWSLLHALRGVMTLRRRPLRGRIDVGIRCFCAGGWQCQTKARQSWVAIAVEERRAGVGRVRMRRLATRSPDELGSFLRSVLARDATIFADGPDTARLLKACGYANPEAATTQRMGSRVQLTAGLAKRWLSGTHQGRYDHQYLQEYLEEFSFRFNRRDIAHPGTLFAHVLEVAVTTRRVR